MIHKISEYISEEKLDKRIREIAAEISKDYAKKEIRLVCILKGSIFYTCELFQAMAQEQKAQAISKSKKI